MISAEAQEGLSCRGGRDATRGSRPLARVAGGKPGKARSSSRTVKKSEKTAPVAPSAKRDLSDAALTFRRARCGCVLGRPCLPGSGALGCCAHDPLGEPWHTPPPSPADIQLPTRLLWIFLTLSDSCRFSAFACCFSLLLPPRFCSHYNNNGLFVLSSHIFSIFSNFCCYLACPSPSLFWFVLVCCFFLISYLLLLLCGWF